MTGDVKKIFSDLTEAEITVFALDNLKKRMILGDALGNIGIYNV